VTGDQDRGPEQDPGAEPSLDLPGFIRPKASAGEAPAAARDLTPDDEGSATPDGGAEAGAGALGAPGDADAGAVPGGDPGGDRAAAADPAAGTGDAEAGRGIPALRAVPAPPGTSKPRGRRRVGPVAAFAAGVAASTFVTAVAAGVAGYEASRSLQPIEFTLRVGLLIAAPCIGAALASLVLPKSIVRRPVWAIGAGTAAGPLIVLRLDRLLQYGIWPTLAGVAAVLAWALAGAVVASTAGTRSDTPVQRTPLPPGPGTPMADGGT
jgi:hypothetical protein